MSKKRLFIIDSMAMAFRNFHAIRPLSTSQGVPVNAVYGSLMFLAGLIEKEKPDYFVFARFAEPITLKQLKADSKLSEMALVQPGQRLSIQPVRPLEWNYVCALSKQILV